MRAFAIGLLVGLLVAGCGNAHAQITVESVAQVCVIKPAEKIETAAGLWVVPADAELTLTPAAIVRLSGLEGFKASAKPILLGTDQEPASVQAIGDATWLVSGPPRVFLSVTAIDFERQLFENEVITVEVSKRPDPVEPDAPDKPDETDDADPVPDDLVPIDLFDNIGRRSNEWATGLPGRRIIAGFYKTAAKSLNADPTKTIDQVGEQLNADVKGSIDGASYGEFIAKQQADLIDRWPLNRFVLAEYFQAVAAGLGAGQ